MESTFISYIILLLIIGFAVMIAQSLKISYPIVLVVTGLLISLIGIFPVIQIDPELIFIIFLPPILYEAAWQTSWKDFWKWRRVIFSFAFIIVIVTSCLVAYVANIAIPGFTLALGFLLGGIVSPPDAVSATSIMKDVNVPKRISAIIEGESLLNDASSIIVFRFALAAITTGTFVFTSAATNFLSTIVFGTLIGLAIALIFYCIHRWFPTTPNIDLVLTFVSPYLMYTVAEEFHFSGVLAVVSGGLLHSNLRQTMLSPLTRIQGTNIWAVISFVLNGLIFLLIGLQLRSIVQQLGDTSIWQAIKYSLIIASTLIVSRLIIAMATSVFARFLSKFIKTADPNPGFKAPFVLGWSGMRGVVSLAAALSIPLMVNNQPFPQRNLILFITFTVILITLVLQGLSLPWIIRVLNLKEKDYTTSESDQELLLQKSLAHCALKFIEKYHKKTVEGNEMLRALKQRLENNFFVLKHITRPEKAEEQKTKEVNDYERVHKKIIKVQRKLLQSFNKRASINEEIVKKYLLTLDMEEEQLSDQVKLF